MALNSFGRVAASSGKSLAQLKNLFFDRSAVEKAAERGQVRALSRLGAYVRRAAQTSMRRRKRGVSEPGQPPFAKSGEMRDLLFFSYDPLTRSVVVGPLGFRGSPVPHLHEFGGSVPADGRVLYLKNSPGRDASGQFVTAGVRRVVLAGMVHYPKRPFMAPALEKVLPKFAEAFRGTVTR